MDPFLLNINDRLYATAEAYIVERPDQLPRELASEYDRSEMNPSFTWIAGRYVQANNLNRNGQFWTYDDLQRGEASIRYTPMNALHQYDKPIGTIVETKIVHREDREASSERLLPEIQALGVMWSANFPELANLVKQAHAEKQLWWSMECVAESKQCLTCDQIYPYRAQAHEVCEHLAQSALAPRRFINPTFLGGALIFAPEKPGWADADVTEVAMKLTAEYANRGAGETTWLSEVTDPQQWEKVMALLQSAQSVHRS